MLPQTYDDAKIHDDFATTVARNYLNTATIESNIVPLFSGTLKRASSPTMIQPVIASQPETMILPEGLSHQPVFAHNHYQPKEPIANIALTSVIKGYSINDVEPVKNYLATNSDLLDFLTRVSCKLKEVDAIDSIELEHYYDSEEGWEKLFIIANTQLEDMDVLDQLEADLFGSLFEAETPWLSGRVVLSIG